MFVLYIFMFNIETFFFVLLLKDFYIQNMDAKNLPKVDLLLFYFIFFFW